MVYGVFAYSQVFGYEFIATVDNRNEAYKYAKELNNKNDDTRRAYCVREHYETKRR